MSNNQFDLTKFKLIVGLGNVGKNYLRTRHNAGFLFLDYLQKKQPEYKTALWKSDTQFKGEYIKLSDLPILLKPSTMMNLSGESVQALAKYFGIQSNEIVIAFDDLDMVLGTYKLQLDKGPKVHNGLTSVANKLGTTEFWHLRIGIEGREVKGNKAIPGMAFALANFTQVEIELLDKVFKTILLSKSI